MMRGRLRADGRLHRRQVAERHDDRSRGAGVAEAFQVLLVAGRGDGRQRAAVEGALEGDDAPALGLAVGEVIAPRQLDGALAGLRAGIAEEHLVGERHLAQPLGQPLLAGDAIEIGAVPQLLRLLGERGDQLGMRVAQRIDGNAAGEIEIALARRSRPARRPRRARTRGSGARRWASRPRRGRRRVAASAAAFDLERLWRPSRKTWTSREPILHREGNKKAALWRGDDHGPQTVRHRSRAAGPMHDDVALLDR